MVPPRTKDRWAASQEGGERSRCAESGEAGPGEGERSGRRAGWGGSLLTLDSLLVILRPLDEKSDLGSGKYEFARSINVPFFPLPGLSGCTHSLHPL